MKSGFNTFIPNNFVVFNSITKKAFAFKSRNEFINFLMNEVKLDKKEMLQFEKDLKLLSKKMLVLKYLPHFYVKEKGE